MRCLTDQPLRVQLSPSGVIHAASHQDYGGFTRYKYNGARLGEKEFVPKQKRINMACRWHQPKKALENFLVSKAEKITCKACMKAMGMDDSPLAPDRFVVRKKDTGEFYKNTSTRCSAWADEVTDAFFFKRKHTAEDKCKVYRYDVDGKLLTRTQWLKAGKPRHKNKRVLDPNLEIRPVKIRVE